MKHSGFDGKKVLVLGGASVHCKLVEAAHALGLYVIVADYLEESPAKMIADESSLINIYDVDALESLCKQKGVSAILSSHLDPGQRPYCQLCERLKLPCIGNSTMFYQMTDKIAFKKMCKDNGVSIVEEYLEEDIYSGKCAYPVFIKPVDSRGSRGQSVCRSFNEAVVAVQNAKRESSNGKCIIERFVETGNEVQITYFFVDGEAYLIRTVDSYKSDYPGMEKVVSCAVSPSVFTEEYIKSTHEAVVRMFKNMGMRNGPIFMQGFYDNGVFRFFDPGLRFPGVEYEKIFDNVFGINLLKLLWVYALTGEMPQNSLKIDSYWDLNGKVAAVLFPAMKAGKIKSIEGMADLGLNRSVVAYSLRHVSGECVEWTMNVNQRFAEVDILEDNVVDLSRAIDCVQANLFPVSEEGEDMSFAKFDVNRIMKSGNI